MASPSSSPARPTPGFDLLERLRAESVVRVDGEVVARSRETVNPALPTGGIEVRVRAVTVLSEAAELRCRCSASPTIPRTSASPTATST